MFLGGAAIGALTGFMPASGMIADLITVAAVMPVRGLGPLKAVAQGLVVGQIAKRYVPIPQLIGGTTPAQSQAPVGNVI